MSPWTTRVGRLRTLRSPLVISMHTSKASKSDLRVLISGAGIAGPALALFLARTGAQITIVEKASEILPHGQTVDIQGSARLVIEKMGVLDEVRRRNTSEKGTRFIDPEGRPFAALPMKQGSNASFTSEFEILRGDLAATFYEATRELSNVDYLFSTTVKQVVSNDKDGVKVELSSGQTKSFDLLVAADGQWSKVRKQCFPAEAVQVIDMGMHAIYCTIPRLPSDDDWWNIYQALGSRLLALRPDPYGTIRAMFTLMPRDEAHNKKWLEAARSNKQVQEKVLREEFADAGWKAERFLDGVSQAPDFYFHAIQQIKMSSWSSSCVTCLGDTAYAPTPLSGMGTSLAITGAYVLAGELSKLDHGEHPSRALEAYERILRPFVEESQKIPFFMPAVAHPDTAFKRWLCRVCIRLLSSVIAAVTSNAWLASKLFVNDYNDFSLPHYPKLEDSSKVGDAQLLA